MGDRSEADFSSETDPSFMCFCSPIESAVGGNFYTQHQEIRLNKI